MFSLIRRVYPFSSKKPSIVDENESLVKDVETQCYAQGSILREKPLPKPPEIIGKSRKVLCKLLKEFQKERIDVATLVDQSGKIFFTIDLTHIVENDKELKQIVKIVHDSIQKSSDGCCSDENSDEIARKLKRHFLFESTKSLLKENNKKSSSNKSKFFRTDSHTTCYKISLDEKEIKSHTYDEGAEEGIISLQSYLAHEVFKRVEKKLISYRQKCKPPRCEMEEDKNLSIVFSRNCNRDPVNDSIPLRRKHESKEKYKDNKTIMNRNVMASGHSIVSLVSSPETSFERTRKKYKYKKGTHASTTDILKDEILAKNKYHEQCQYTKIKYKNKKDEMKKQRKREQISKTHLEGKHDKEYSYKRKNAKFKDEKIKHGKVQEKKSKRKIKDRRHVGEKEKTQREQYKDEKKRDKKQHERKRREDKSVEKKKKYRIHSSEFFETPSKSKKKKELEKSEESAIVTSRKEAKQKERRKLTRSRSVRCLTQESSHEIQKDTSQESMNQTSDLEKTYYKDGVDGLSSTSRSDERVIQCFSYT